MQVFPTGPPPPPPVPLKAQLAPQLPSGTRPSPARSPQSFEPPPMGCRPEIKIPSNPMATLKKVPKPEPKNDFWIEEYRKERSKSPLPDSVPRESTAPVEHSLPEPVRQYNENKSQDTTDFGQRYAPTADYSISENRNGPSKLDNVQASINESQKEHQHDDGNSVGAERATIKPNSIQQQQDRINSPFTTSSPTPNLPKPLSPIKSNQSNQEPETQYYVRSTQSKPSSVHQSILMPHSPARVLNPTARVAQSPARVLSPTPRVISPPPAVQQSKLANSRNVSPTHQ